MAQYIWQYLYHGLLSIKATRGGDNENEINNINRQKLYSCPSGV